MQRNACRSQPGSAGVGPRLSVRRDGEGRGRAPHLPEAQRRPVARGPGARERASDGARVDLSQLQRQDAAVGEPARAAKRAGRRRGQADREAAVNPGQRPVARHVGEARPAVDRPPQVGTVAAAPVRVRRGRPVQLGRSLVLPRDDAIVVDESAQRRDRRLRFCRVDVLCGTCSADRQGGDQDEQCASAEDPQRVRDVHMKSCPPWPEVRSSAS